MKKGFTLVELLAVLLIIALISTLALTNMSKISSGVKDISNQRIEELLKSSAKAYISNDNQIKNKLRSGEPYEITYNELYNSKYISNDLIDVKTYEKIDINNFSICVRYQNYNYTYTIVKRNNCTN